MKYRKCCDLSIGSAKNRIDSTQQKQVGQAFQLSFVSCRDGELKFQLR
jgi:hypothetical protein